VLVYGVFILTKFVHFIGIGGVSMSGIAKILLNNGFKVSGSDISRSDSVEELISLGAEVFIGHSASNITNQDLVVYTSAVHDDNPEIVEAKKKNIELTDRATMLGTIMREYANAISVAGTHGKTTATSMFAYVLLAATLDPTIMVGGTLDGIKGNLRIGNSSYFLTETCEYMRNFLKFSPKYAIILNVEEDHLDYYKDIDDIISAFREFCTIVPDDGFVVANKECANTVKTIENCAKKVYTFGYSDADFCATNISYTEFGYPVFDITDGDKKIIHLELNVVGAHNVLNATAVALTCFKMGIAPEHIKAGLESYKGTKRRFEKKGYVNEALIIDDYAHHPTEISATFKALKNVTHKSEWCIFQPHTYTRTKSLLDEFAVALSQAEHVIITDIFAAREKDTGIVHARDLAERIENAIYLSTFEEIAQFIKQNAKPGDVVITMGAGNVCEISKLLV